MNLNNSGVIKTSRLGTEWFARAATQAISGAQARAGASRWSVLTLSAALLIAVQPLAKGADGGLDPTFGQGGLVTTDFSNGIDEAHATIVQSDGRIVVVGITSDGVGDFDFALARYNPSGALDLSFGTSGR